jgi:hypothetical protein
MRVVSTSRWFLALILMSLFALSLSLSGCSTLGIATADDLEATQAGLENQVSSNRTRTDALEGRMNALADSLQQVSQSQATHQASIDSLENRFQRAADWLNSMDFDTMSKDVSDAKGYTRQVTQSVLDWLIGQRSFLDTEIQKIETMLNEDQGGGNAIQIKGAEESAPAEESPAEGG